MSEKKEVIFADGFIVKKKDNAPEWVLGSLSIKVDEAIVFLKEHSNKGWVNIEMKLSRDGKPYCQLDTWQPTPKTDAKTETVVVTNDESEEDLPF
tara:strand:- start:2073 stop:2357 length:285 start_codon:yes stop_codon:yes gene_type:complete